MTPRVQSSAAYYDATAASWTDAYTADTAGGHALRERLLRVLAVFAQTSPGLLVDVGCGTGFVGAALAERGWRVVGLDAALGMVTEARVRLPAPSLGALLADSGALPLRDRCADAAMCLGVLDHVDDPATTLSEIARVVRPGGTVVLTVPNAHSPYARWAGSCWRPAVGAVKRRLGRAGLDSRVHQYSRRAAADLVRTAGLEPVSVRGYWVNLLLSPLDELAPRLAGRLCGALERLTETRLDVLGAGWVVVARRAPES